MLIQKRPKVRFIGDGKMDFERHLKELQTVFSMPGISWELKLSELSYWFGGVADLVVTRFALRTDAEIAYKECIAELKKE